MTTQNSVFPHKIISIMKSRSARPSTDVSLSQLANGSYSFLSLPTSSNVCPLSFSSWSYECRVNSMTWTPLIEEGSRLPPCQPLQLPAALRRPSRPTSSPQAATPPKGPETIYHACCTAFSFLLFIANILIEALTLSCLDFKNL